MPAATWPWQYSLSFLRVPKASMVTGGWNSTTTVAQPSPATCQRWLPSSMSPYQANSGRK